MTAPEVARGGLIMKFLVLAIKLCDARFADAPQLEVMPGSERILAGSHPDDRAPNANGPPGAVFVWSG